MKRSWYLRNFIPMLLFPIANFYLFEWYSHNPWESMKVPIQFLNIYLFELLMLIGFVLFGRLKWSLRIQSIFFMLVGLANYYILQFRSAPIMPWDIYSVGTALSVADNFKYTLEKQTIFVLLGFLFLILAESMVNLDLRALPSYDQNRTAHKNVKTRMVGIRVSSFVVLIGLLYQFTHMLHLDSTILKYGMYDKLFTPTVMSNRDGTAVAFLMELKYVSVDKPANYSASYAKELLAAEENTITPDTTPPNIIVIMNEAFSDPAILGAFETNKDYMPYVHSILNGTVDNTISGWLDVSVLGGNTANTEFEFLTGNTMAFLPQGSVPYQQYIKKELPSLASHLKDLGYETIAAHPYNSTGWDRNKVYPLLGFDRMYFIKDYKNPQKIRNYVSDQTCYEKIIEFYENKPNGTPLFSFHVTMQNHSSYTGSFDNFHPDIEVYGSNSTALNNYLSLLKLSDIAIQNLTEYFSNVDEHTIIVFFGDHQPTDSVVSTIWKQNGKNGNALSDEDKEKRYKVPFFIWSNYDIDIQTNVETSANFLAVYLLKTANLPLNNYQTFLFHLSETYPVVTAVQTQDLSGDSTDSKALNDYAILQYYWLFGK